MIDEETTWKFIKTLMNIKADDWEVDGTDGWYYAMTKLNEVEILINSHELIVDRENITLTETQREIVKNFVGYLAWPFIKGQETRTEKYTREKRECLKQKIMKIVGE